MAKYPGRPRRGGQGELSWDRIRRQALETHEVAEDVAEKIELLRKDEKISPVADLQLSLVFCQLNLAMCIIDALKLSNDNARDRETIFKEWLANALIAHAKSIQSF